MVSPTHKVPKSIKDRPSASPTPKRLKQSNLLSFFSKQGSVSPTRKIGSKSSSFTIGTEYQHQTSPNPTVKPNSKLEFKRRSSISKATPPSSFASPPSFIKAKHPIDALASETISISSDSSDVQVIERISSQPTSGEKFAKFQREHTNKCVGVGNPNHRDTHSGIQASIVKNDTSVESLFGSQPGGVANTTLLGTSPEQGTPLKRDRRGRLSTNEGGKFKKEDVEDNFSDEEDIPLSRSRRKRTRVNYREIGSSSSESGEDDEDDDIEYIPPTNNRMAVGKSYDNDNVNDAEDIVNIGTKENPRTAQKELENGSMEEDDYDDDDDDLLQLGRSTQTKSTPRSTSSKVAKSRYSGSSKPKTVHTTPLRDRTNIVTNQSNNFSKMNEERYQWLVNERDAEGRPPTDPEYDPRTLYIPPSAWNKFTPFERQYWEIKSKMWDCIVFFKKGKFFELYEKDALLANSLFDLKLAGNGRANMQLAGIPEMSFDYWATQFIDHGYKVAKVDQKESMLAKEMREGSKGIVRRELECVLTSGTLTDGEMIHTDLATYCLAIREEAGSYYMYEDENIGKAESSFPDRLFGVAIIDTSTGEMQLLEFEDDNECTKLDTLMSQVIPKEIVVEKNNLSRLANKVVKFNAAPKAVFNEIKPDTEFYDYDKTYNVLISPESGYFEDISKWPKVLREYYEKKKKIGFSAFGGLLYYLRWLKLDKGLLSMGNLAEYNLVKSQNSLILDGITLQNLEIFTNTFDGSDRGTLFRLVNRGITAMGKRMMRRWLMHPLLHTSDIEKRLDSVDLLMSNVELRQIFEASFSGLPDLERMLSRIHAGSIKVKDFDRVIQGFEEIAKVIRLVTDRKFALNGALNEFVKQVPSALYEDVDSWLQAFDRQKAVNENVIVPKPGVIPEFDESLASIKAIENELIELLNKYKRQFKCPNIVYKDSGKELYTIEVPMKVTKLIPPSWVQMGANKSAKRYYSDEVRALARRIAEAKEMHKVLQEDLKARFCQKFDSKFNSTWSPTVHAISNIDCLIALTRTSESLGLPHCRPIFSHGSEESGTIKFKELRHPCFNLGASIVRDFIPNDIELGGDYPQLGLLTGANAAGKSTVLRMTCIAVILAQLGCYVPCKSAYLTPIDRIMTRLGANDNIMQGKSTFYVELSETKKILDLATKRSLLVVDELGRGGSSSDGFAIAEAVLHHVATHIQSLGFFATHYGTLGAHFLTHPQVRPLKMSILVDEATRRVTFLYKLVPGQSEGSFGMHVATMCGIPGSIVDTAEEAAEGQEHTTRLMRERQLALNKIDGELVDVPLGLQSDLVRLVFGDGLSNTSLGTGENVVVYDAGIKAKVLSNLFKMIDRIV